MSDLTPERVRELLEGATPGPWEVRPPRFGFVDVAVTTPGKPAAICGFPATRSYNEANAALIAAAPDLARALLEAWESEKKLKWDALCLIDERTDLRAEVERLRGKHHLTEEAP